MSKLSTDLGTTRPLHPRETLFQSGVLAALNAEVIVAADGASTVSVDLRGTFNMTVAVEGTADGVNWSAIPMRLINAAAIGYVVSITGTNQGIWVGSCAQFKSVRARCASYTSGSVTTTVIADTATLVNTAVGMTTPVVLTATGAAGAAVTATIASPGPGLRHYITYISIVRSASVALTPGAAPTVITTTNLPGALAFTMGLDAAAQGVDKIIREDFAYPLAASAQGTATTIVCPVLTGAIWRVTVGYYVAP